MAEPENSKAPFFLYLPFQNIHGPYTVAEEYFNEYDNTTLNDKQRTMFAYITEMDNALGYILNKLKETEQYNNTWIFATSDNGAPNAPQVEGRNFPLRGFKTSLWEGGVRVPAFVHSPLLPEDRRGVHSHELFHVTDLLPTLLHLAGITSKPAQTLDGFSILDSIVSGAPSPRSEILINVNPLCSSQTDSQASAPRAAIRVGDMKLLVPCFRVKGINASNVTEPVLSPPFIVHVPHTPGEAPFQGPNTWPMLFNVSADIGETINLAPQYKDIVNDLMAKLTKHAETMVEPMQWFQPFQGDNYECSKCPLQPALGSASEASIPWIK
jgi:arylsulfatase A-like enzyme